METNPLRDWITKSDKYKSPKKFFEENNISLALYSRLLNVDSNVLRNTYAHTFAKIKRLTNDEVNLYSWFETNNK